jgi:hypothetical protein
MTTKKTAKKKKTTKPKADKVQVYLMPVSKFNVNPGTAVRVFCDYNGVRHGRVTWYALNTTHIMPRNHAELFCHAGHITKGAIAPLPPSSKLEYTGIPALVSDSQPPIELPSIEYAEVSDLDAITDEELV